VSALTGIFYRLSSNLIETFHSCHKWTFLPRYVLAGYALNYIALVSQVVSDGISRMSQDHLINARMSKARRLESLLVYKVFEVFVHSKHSCAPAFLSITKLIIAFLFPNRSQFLLKIQSSEPLHLDSPLSLGKVGTTLSISHRSKYLLQNDPPCGPNHVCLQVFPVYC